MAANEAPKATLIKWEAEDADLIAWLQGKPKTYIIKQALRLYKAKEEAIFNEVGGSTQAAPSSEADDIDF